MGQPPRLAARNRKRRRGRSAAHRRAGALHHPAGPAIDLPHSQGRKLVFVNPTTRIHVPQPAPKTPEPVNLDILRADLDSDAPATAALATLLAFHAVRMWQLRQLRLTDLHDGRLHVGDQVIPLAPPVRKRLTAYLDYRQRTWPRSINPHLFIHTRSATTTHPVTLWWIRRQLGISGQQIRLDRILDEAHATGGDIRRLMDLFGLSVAGAHRYIATVNHPQPASRA